MPQVYKDKQEPLDYKGQQEQPVLPVFKVQLDPKEPQVQLDQLGQLGLAQLVQQDQLVIDIPQHHQLV